MWGRGSAQYVRIVRFLSGSVGQALTKRKRCETSRTDEAVGGRIYRFPAAQIPIERRLRGFCRGESVKDCPVFRDFCWRRPHKSFQTAVAFGFRTCYSARAWRQVFSTILPARERPRAHFRAGPPGSIVHANPKNRCSIESFPGIWKLREPTLEVSRRSRSGRRLEILNRASWNAVGRLRRSGNSRSPTGSVARRRGLCGCFRNAEPCQPAATPFA